jgi:hypothetical protein
MVISTENCIGPTILSEEIAILTTAPRLHVGLRIAGLERFVSWKAVLLILLWLRLVFILQVMILVGVCVCVASDPAEENTTRKKQTKKGNEKECMQKQKVKK